MIVNVSSSKYRISFYKYHIKFMCKFDKHTVEYDQLNTKCVILDISSSAQSPLEVSVGHALLSRLDTYNKITGKRVALAHALKATPEFNNYSLRRVAIWGQFKKTFGIVKE